jgi:hypothetical protein
MASSDAPAIAIRSLEPELLDVLPAGDPQAIESRRDLVWINALMRQAPIMRRLLLRHAAEAPRRILEIGAGDGRFMLTMARRLAKRWPGVELVLLDRTTGVFAQTTRAEFGRLGWRAEALTADIFDWAADAGKERFDVICANLFLHHFDDAQLTRLFGPLARLAPLFVATEPLRARLPLWATRLLPAIGANPVTLHDAAASVRAGFAGGELGRLWPASVGPVLEERRAGLFTHVFAAAGGQ